MATAFLKPLGERKYFGRRSPQDRLFIAAGVPYRGARRELICKGPWYLYETAQGSPATNEALQELEQKLLKAGFTVSEGDADMQKFVDADSKTKYARWYNHETKAGVESLHISTYVTNKKLVTHIGHIFYPKSR